MSAEHHLLFGLLALQNGLIDQTALVAAFHAWTRDKTRPLADHLVALGHLDRARRAAVEAMAALHLEAHGGDAEKSLAAVPAGGSTREGLARLADVDITASLGHLGAASTGADSHSDRTASYSVGTASSEGVRFRVLRPHARGGLGAVFVALDNELHREVALKQILDHHADDPMSRQRFLVEAEITGGLEHPGIVPVYGLGNYADGRPFYAMRFIRGDSLKEAIDRFHGEESVNRESGWRSLELRRLLGRFVDVCNAIEYAHSRGVLHRDLKPGNIIVGKHGETLVVDWGLAKATGRAEPGAGERTLLPASGSDSAQTSPGSALGTPAYMSPEQATGDLERLGPRSDVYSLGGTLYCLLTGKPPHEGQDLFELLRRVQRGELVRPRLLDPSIDPALEAICMKAMALHQEDRYFSPRLLADDIERWMADEPVTAYREPFSRRMRRWATRNRTAVATATAMLLASVIGLAAVLAIQTQAKAEIARALASETQANVELAKSKAAVQARYNLAVAAIKTFHTGVSEDFLVKQDQFKELRDRLLKSASDFYGQLSALLGKETDAASRRALAASNYELALLTAKVGRKEDALAAHRAVLADREALASRAGADTATKIDVGHSLNIIAELLLDTGKSDEALATYRRSESLLASLAAADPTARAALANCRSWMGWLLRSTGKNTDALAAYRLARADQEALAAGPNASSEARRDLAATIHRLAYLFSEMGNMTAAEAEYRTALRIEQELANGHPGVTQFRSALASSHNNLAMLLSETGKSSEAEAQYRTALATWQALADDKPAIIEFRNQLAKSHNNLANLLRKTGDRSEAEAEYRRAILIQQKLADDNPAVIQIRSELAGMYGNLAVLLRGNGKRSEAEAEYRRAIPIQQKLADDNPAVVRLRYELARTRNNLAILLSESNTSEAQAEFRKAIQIHQKLAADNPAVTQFRNDLARSHNNLGLLLATTGKLTEAQAEYRSAIPILQKLADLNPAVTQFRSDLATSRNNLGNLLSKTGKPRDAEAEYRKAIPIQHKLADDNPAVAQFRIELARSHHDLGQVLSEMGRASDRESADRAELAIRQKLADDNPANPEFQRDLAGTLLNLGWQLAQAGKTGEAIGYYKREEVSRQKLAAAGSATAGAKDALANCQINLADALRRSGRLGEALAACERSLASRDPLVKAHPQVPGYRARLGETFLRLGQVRYGMRKLSEASASWKRACAEFDATKTLEPPETFLCACCHAGLAALGGRPGSGVSAAEGAEQAEQAMTVLRRAASQGFRDPESYRTESALDPLRERLDFKLLMMDVAMPTKPFAPTR